MKISLLRYVRLVILFAVFLQLCVATLTEAGFSSDVHAHTFRIVKRERADFSDQTDGFNLLPFAGYASNFGPVCVSHFRNAKFRTASLAMNFHMLVLKCMRFCVAERLSSAAPTACLPRVHAPTGFGAKENVTGSAREKFTDRCLR